MSNNNFWQAASRNQPLFHSVGPAAHHVALKKRTSGGGAGGVRLGLSLQVGLLLLAIVFGVANRVLYKAALVPMKDYIFFLAQFQNSGYLAVYFSILWYRKRTGMITPPMEQMDKRPLWAVGACEAAAQLMFMFSAARLPGPMLPVVNQSNLIWNMVFAAMLLKTRFSSTQLYGTALITMGVVLAAAPASMWSWLAGRREGIHGHEEPVQAFDLALGVFCFAFPALASIMKDMVFRREKERMGHALDIFMVNSYGSLYQTIFVMLFLPLTSAHNGISFTQLPTYLWHGAQCMMGYTPHSHDSHCGGCDYTDAALPCNDGSIPCNTCAGAPILPLAYVAANLAFNIAMLDLQRNVGAVTTQIVQSCLVPLTIVAFALPWPLLPASPMSPGFLFGSIVLCAGIAVYNYQQLVRPVVQAIKEGDGIDLPLAKKILPS